MKRGEVFGDTKTERVPLYPFGDSPIRCEDYAAYQQHLALEWMIERLDEPMHIVSVARRAFVRPLSCLGVCHSLCSKIRSPPNARAQLQARLIKAPALAGAIRRAIMSCSVTL